MVKKLFTLFCGSVIAFSLSTAAFAQAAPAQEKMDKMAKHGRWEGVVIRNNPDKSTLTVRKVGSTNDERTIHYDVRLAGSVRNTAAKKSTRLMGPRSKMVIG